MTPRQLEVLDYVRMFDEGGYSPTLAQITTRLGLASRSSAHRLVDGLVASGHLIRDAGKRRGIRIAGQPDLRLASSDALRAELSRRGERLGALDRYQPRARGRQVTCAADTCGVAVHRGHLFCRAHWFALPEPLREGILTAFGRGDLDEYQELVARARDVADGCSGAIS